MTAHKIVLAGAAAAALAVGGVVVTAPGASAASPSSTVGSSACTLDVQHRTAKITGKNVRMHSGPTYLGAVTSPPTLRLLQKGARVDVYCMYLTMGSPINPKGWVYLKHDASGWKGWVWSDYISGVF